MSKAKKRQKNIERSNKSIAQKIIILQTEIGQSKLQIAVVAKELQISEKAIIENIKTQKPLTLNSKIGIEELLVLENQLNRNGLKYTSETVKKKKFRLPYANLINTPM